MDNALKQRLVGAGVLVALAVIFIPVLLDKNSDDDRLTVKMEIPPKPEDQGTDRLKVHEPIADIQIPDIQLQDPPESTQTQIETSPEVEPKISTKPAETKPSPKPAKQAPAKTTVAKITATTKPVNTVSSEQWIIQLGSFSNEANARVLKDKFEVAGYKTFIERGDGVAGAVYRVRVGPVPERDKADALRSKIQKSGHQKAIVMQY